jgi:hypothetical protein
MCCPSGSLFQNKIAAEKNHYLFPISTNFRVYLDHLDHWNKILKYNGFSGQGKVYAIGPSRTTSGMCCGLLPLSSDPATWSK